MGDMSSGGILGAGLLMRFLVYTGLMSPSECRGLFGLVLVLIMLDGGGGMGSCRWCGEDGCAGDRERGGECAGGSFGRLDERLRWGGRSELRRDGFCDGMNSHMHTSITHQTPNRPADEKVRTRVRTRLQEHHCNHGELRAYLQDL